MHISHRGGAGISPENTLYAFRRAVGEFRTDMLELDVHLTRDREVVVSHDGTVDRCTGGTGAIAAMDLADLQRLDAAYRFSTDGGHTFPLRGQGIRIPTLREVIRAFPATLLNVELKSAAAGDEGRLVGLLREEKAMDRVRLGSADDGVAARLYREAPEAFHFYPRFALAAFVLLARVGLKPPREPRYSELDAPLNLYGVRIVEPRLIDAVHRAGKTINVWTVNDPGDMRRLIQEGVDGIMSDRPDLLRQALDQLQPHAPSGSR